MKSNGLIAGLVIGLFFSLRPLSDAASGATITSDELELKNNGDLTIFSGHVILSQDAYQIRADRMVRAKATGLVDATGHVQGTWTSDKNEKIRVTGDQARYNPETETMDIWGPKRVGVQLDGPKGKASFIGDKGWAYTHKPGKAKLSGQVSGHIIPAGGS